MSADQLFSICNAVALVGWILLIIVPRWKWTTQLITSCIIPLVLGGLYAGLMATQIGGAEGGFGSLEDIARLFQNPYVLLAGWVHYLAFDLFVGSWIVRDAGRMEIRHWFVLPCLLLTFVLGPVGLLLYFLLRGSLRQTILIDESASVSR